MLKVRKKTVGLIVLQLLLIVFLIGNLSFIWINSSKDSVKSDKTSISIAEPLAKRTVKNYNKLPKPEQKKHVAKMNAKIRTFGHFAEFMALGLLFFSLSAVLFDFKNSKFKRLFLMCLGISLGMCLVCAVSDEIHQLFVKGRTFQISDIVVDITGSFCGCILATVPVGIFKGKLI